MFACYFLKFICSGLFEVDDDVFITLQNISDTLNGSEFVTMYSGNEQDNIAYWEKMHGTQDQEQKWMLKLNEINCKPDEKIVQELYEFWFPILSQQKYRLLARFNDSNFAKTTVKIDIFYLYQRCTEGEFDFETTILPNAVISNDIKNFISGRDTAILIKQKDEDKKNDSSMQLVGKLIYITKQKSFNGGLEQTRHIFSFGDKELTKNPFNEALKRIKILIDDLEEVIAEVGLFISPLLQ